MLLVVSLLLSSVVFADIVEKTLDGNAVASGLEEIPSIPSAPLASEFQQPKNLNDVLPSIFKIPNGLRLPVQPFVFKQKSKKRRQLNAKRRKRKMNKADADDDDDDDDEKTDKDCKDGKNAQGVSECEENEFKCDIKVWKKFMKEECPETCGDCD